VFRPHSAADAGEEARMQRRAMGTRRAIAACPRARRARGARGRMGGCGSAAWRRSHGADAAASSPARREVGGGEGIERRPDGLCFVLFGALVRVGPTALWCERTCVRTNV
jgi:hypothetical protein